MSKALERARQQFQVGQFKKAADTLWEVTFAGDDGDAEARAVVALASQLRDSTQGGLREQCEEHLARAERYLSAAKRGEAAERESRLEAELRRDPVAAARRAYAAGLNWFRFASAVDLVAASLLEALRDAEAGSSSQPACAIDAVEAEGWHLEHITRSFRPVNVELYPLGVNVLTGGQLVESAEEYQYVFRRVDGTSG